MTIPRTLLAAGLLAAGAAAAPVLTTIQDVLYKADGTRFNGTLMISWNSFQAADSSTIVTQVATVKVVDGHLRVQLVPTTSGTPAIPYTVIYNSDGRIMFTERWSVPSSGTPVRLRDVRISSTSPLGGGSAPPPEVGTVQESDVEGLVADLIARPLKGPGYAPGRVAVVNSTGALESAFGADSDCVRVDGSAGPCGATASSFVDAEALSGIVDGSNTSFMLNATPDPPTSLAVFRNGLLQKLDSDYTISSRNVQFVTAATPQPGDTLLASYRLGGTDAGAPQIFPNAQVLCSGLGAATTSTTLASVGTCSIPAGTLLAGDRVEIRFDYEHAGSASAFSIDVKWGVTTLVHRDAAANETLVTGKADAGILSAGAHISSQTWGTVLSFAATTGTASDDSSAVLIIDFRASVAGGGDTVTLRNFTVLRYP